MTIVLDKDFLHQLDESILDKPQAGLDKKIWHFNGQNYTLQPFVREAIYKILQWVQHKFNIPNMHAMMVGSLTSNSYSDESDIDIHVSSDAVDEVDADKLTDDVKNAFKDEFAVQYPEYAEIEGYRVEVFFQKNKFQDLMSVGCYDLLNQRWIVGPEFKNISFDPYAQWYFKDLDYIGDDLDSIRDAVMKAYETSLVFTKTDDALLKKKLSDDLLSQIELASLLFDKIREKRSKVSQLSTSPEKAAQLRKSEKWHIADSSYKLFNVLGYQLMLRTLAKCKNELEAGTMSMQDAAKEVLAAASEGIAQNNECEQLFTSEFIADNKNIKTLDESLKNFAKTMFLATLMAVPGILSATDVAKQLQKIPQEKLTSVNTPEVKKAMKTAASKTEVVSGMTYIYTLNAIAKTIWCEAWGEFEQYGKKALDAIASVIWNRAGGDPDQFINVIKTKSQFSEWNSYKGGFTDATYKYFVPINDITLKKTNNHIWFLCQQIAEQMLDGTFKSTIGNRNMIGNPKKDNEIAKSTWGKNCDLTIGSHTFGYQPEQDGWAKNKKKAKSTATKPQDKSSTSISNPETQNIIYVVKNGDSLWKIARAHKTTIEQIKTLNGLTSNTLRIGQKLKI